MNEPQSAVYVNWHSPLLFDMAPRHLVVGPNWSTTEMLKILKRIKPETYQYLSHSSIEG